MGVIYMKEKMVRLSQLNLSGLLESSIKSVENDFKEKYLNENESLSDYGFNRNDIINSYIELFTNENKDIFIPFAYKKVGFGDDIYLLDENKIFNNNNSADIGDLKLSYTSDIGFLLSHADNDCVIIKVGYAIDNQTSGFKAKENVGVLKPKMQCYLNRFLSA